MAKAIAARAQSVDRALHVAGCSGSSQVPKASTRCGASAAVTSVGSPMISGSSAPAPRRRESAVRRAAAHRRGRSRPSTRRSRRAPMPRVRRAGSRVRTSRIAVTTAKQRMPSVSASAAISCRSSARTRRHRRRMSRARTVPSSRRLCQVREDAGRATASAARNAPYRIPRASAPYPCGPGTRVNALYAADEPQSPPR